MEKLLKEFIEKNKLFQPGDRILLAVSGGIDSVVMLHLFNKCGFSTGIAHCNFGLRGEESDLDEIFVEKLAQQYNIPAFKTRFDTLSHAKEKRISIQMAARELRFKWFEEIRAANHYNYIALAQHIDDEVETFFINLIRGTGIAGLHGIKPRFKRIIRPLLFAKRDDIVVYAKQNQIAFREDSSNKSNKYLRNKLRLDVLPLFEGIRPGFSELIHENIERIQFAEFLYKKYLAKLKRQFVEKSINKTIIHFNSFKNTKYKEYLLYEFLKSYEFSRHTCNDISFLIDKKEHSGRWFYSKTYSALLDRDTIIITPKLNEPIEESIFITPATKSVKVNNTSLSIEQSDFEPVIFANSQKNIAFIDLAKCKYPLKVRKWESGDFFFPLGMGMKKKKLSDYFTDKKFSILEKSETLLLVDSDDNIIWIIGHHLDERFKVTDKTLKIGKFTFY